MNKNSTPLSLKADAGGAVSETLQFRRQDKNEARNHHQILSDLLKNGSLADAGKQILQDGYAVRSKDLREFSFQCLRAGRTDLLEPLFATAAKAELQDAGRFLALCLKAEKNSGSCARIAQSIGELCPVIRKPSHVIEAFLALQDRGFEAEAVLLRSCQKSVFEDPDAFTKFSMSDGNPSYSPDLLERTESLADWLQIPLVDRERWKERQLRGRLEARRLKSLLTYSPEFVEAFGTKLVPADLAPLKELVEAGRPAVASFVHTGVHLGFLYHLEWQNIPMVLLGSGAQMQTALPGGHRLLPIEGNKSSFHTARRVTSLIKAGQIVAMPSEVSMRGASHPYVHNGYRFYLPDGIPKLAFSRGIPIVWTACYRLRDMIVTECCLGPTPTGSETYQDFRARWFAFALDKIQNIYRADPKNASLLLKADGQNGSASDTT